MVQFSDGVLECAVECAAAGQLISDNVRTAGLASEVQTLELTNIARAQAIRTLAKLAQSA